MRLNLFSVFRPRLKKYDRENSMFEIGPAPEEYHPSDYPVFARYGWVFFLIFIVILAVCRLYLYIEFYMTYPFPQ